MFLQEERDDALALVPQLVEQRESSNLLEFEGSTAEQLANLLRTVGGGLDWHGALARRRRRRCGGAGAAAYLGCLTLPFAGGDDDDASSHRCGHDGRERILSSDR